MKKSQLLFIILLSLSFNLFAVGGGVIGDAGTIVTMPDGTQVPGDFVATFTDDRLPDHLEEINIKDDYPEVYEEFKKLGAFLNNRTVDQGSELFKKVFRDSNLSPFKIVKTSKISCTESNQSGEIVSCAYVFKAFNEVHFGHDKLGVIELKKEMLDSETVTAKLKALLVIHEILHHILNTEKAHKEYKDLHIIISPLITLLRYLIAML